MRRSGVVGLVVGLCIVPALTGVACGSEFRGKGDAASGGDDTGGSESTGGAAGATETGGVSGTAGTAQGGGEPGGADQGGTSSGGAATGGSAGDASSGGSAVGGSAIGGSAGSVSPGGSPTGGAAGAGVSGGGGSAGGGGSPISNDHLVYWFSADVGVTASNGVVSRWSDRSGNGADAVQLSNATRPTLATLGRTALPAILFDGIDDYLGLPPLTARFIQGVTFFAIARATGDPTCMSLMQLSSSSEVDDVSFDRQDGALQYEVYNDWLRGQDDAWAVGESRLVEAMQSPDESIELYINGVSTGLGSFGLPAEVNRNQTFVGRSLYLNCTTFSGEIAEIILYARSLSTEERQRVEVYLTSKWRCCDS